MLFFILVGAFFAAAELALVSLRDSQITKLQDEGRRGRRLAALAKDPNRFLAAGQVGITLAGFISAGFGAAQIAPVITQRFEEWGMNPSLADPLAFILVTIVIVFFSLVLGELVPKRIALQRVETVALFAAAPIDITAKIFRPFIYALSLATDAIVRLFGIDPKAAKEQISGEELRDLVAGHEDLTEQERELIDDVFSAGDRELREVMVPRTEVEFLSASDLIAEAATWWISRTPATRSCRSPQTTSSDSCTSATSSPRPHSTPVAPSVSWCARCRHFPEPRGCCRLLPRCADIGSTWPSWSTNTGALQAS